MARLGIHVGVVTFEPPGADAIPYFPYYQDRDRQLYHYFGMLRAGFWDLWGPRTLLAYLQLLLHGRKILPARGDIHQRGGNVLLDPQGRVRFHHVGSGPADRPNIEHILTLVEKN